MTIVTLTNSIPIQFSQTISEMIFESIDEKYTLKKKNNNKKKKQRKEKKKKKTIRNM